MRRTTLGMLAVVFALSPATSFSQMAMSPKAATYITDEQVKAVNALPGVDRQIVSQDIGKLNEAVGIVHRGPTGAARGTAGAGGGANAAAAGGAGRGAQQSEPCGDVSGTPVPPGTPGGISHDGQTETYIIVSGGGTMVTGGHIVNGRKSPPDSDVTKVLNGPSCSGSMVGADVVKKVVKVGDIVIIPAGVPHGWAEITDHVDYLSVRPDPDRVLSRNYVNPALKK
jgi:mannose-6-phosphate isomerase-like protein (cupin superfamily)